MKYKKIAECPAELQAAIELANAVSAREEHFLPDAQESVSLELIKTELERFPGLYSYLLEETEKRIEKMPFVVSHYDVRRTLITLENYSDFFESRKILRVTASYCQFFFKYPQGSVTSDSFSKQSFTQNIVLRIDGRRIDFAGIGITEILRKVDAKRLRICPICRDVFWATRIEASTCLKKRCSNNFHQRKRRIKEYETRLKGLSQKLEAEIIKLEKQQNKVVPVKCLVEKQKVIVRGLTEKREELTEKIFVEKGKNDGL
jgi:hypothetical protein